MFEKKFIAIFFYAFFHKTLQCEILATVLNLASMQMGKGSRSGEMWGNFKIGQTAENINK